jgi:hypothetical protein
MGQGLTSLVQGATYHIYDGQKYGSMWTQEHYKENEMGEWARFPKVSDGGGSTGGNSHAIALVPGVNTWSLNFRQDVTNNIDILINEMKSAMRTAADDVKAQFDGTWGRAPIRSIT